MLPRGEGGMYRRSQKGRQISGRLRQEGGWEVWQGLKGRQTGIRMQRVMDFGLQVTINHEML